MVFLPCCFSEISSFGDEANVAIAVEAYIILNAEELVHTSACFDFFDFGYGEFAESLSSYFTQFSSTKGNANRRHDTGPTDSSLVVTVAS